MSQKEELCDQCGALTKKKREPKFKLLCGTCLDLLRKKIADESPPDPFSTIELPKYAKAYGEWSSKLLGAWFDVHPRERDEE